MADVTGDVGKQVWIADELGTLKRTVKDSVRMLVGMSDKHGGSGLYIYK